MCTTCTAKIQLLFVALIVMLGHVLSTISDTHNTTSGTDPRKRPNIILFLADDMGYGDLSVYGHPTQEWGAIDKLAAEGMRFTQFYSVSSLCTPSRTAMMTGRFAMRSGMDGNWEVHSECHNQGLPHSEVTFPEVMRDVGYSTGMVGKWHLGTNSYSHDDGSYLPHTQGFDYVGHIVPNTFVWQCDYYKRHETRPKCQRCHLYQNTTIVQQPPRLDNLTATFLGDAKAFLYENHHQPFLLYYSFTQVHTPMFHTKGFKGSSKRGIFGDQINEMAWAVSEIMKLLKELGIENDTLSLFVSDHGPHLEMCEESGSPGMFYGGKASFFEGGVRVPAIAHWPGTIPAGITSTSVVTLMDLFSTFTELSGAKQPDDRHIDGRSFAGLLQPPALKPSQDQCHHHGQADCQYYNQDIHDILFFYCIDRNLTAVRYKQFKIYFRVSPRSVHQGLARNCNGSLPIHDYYHIPCRYDEPVDPPLIYNVEEDPSENFLLDSEDFVDMIGEVRRLVEEKSSTLTDLPEPRFEKSKCSKRFIPCCNPPYCVC